jgi:hypothetical protein
MFDELRWDENLEQTDQQEDCRQQRQHPEKRKPRHPQPPPTLVRSAPEGEQVRQQDEKQIDQADAQQWESPGVRNAFVSARLVALLCMIRLDAARRQASANISVGS